MYCRVSSGLKGVRREPRPETDVLKYSWTSLGVNGDFGDRALGEDWVRRFGAGERLERPADFSGRLGAGDLFGRPADRDLGCCAPIRGVGSPGWKAWIFDRARGPVGATRLEFLPAAQVVDDIEDAESSDSCPPESSSMGTTPPAYTIAFARTASAQIRGTV
jgi:hypothetical protein